MEAVIKAMSLPRKLWDGKSKSLIELGYTRIGIDECATLSPDCAVPTHGEYTTVAGADPVPALMLCRVWLSAGPQRLGKVCRCSWAERQAHLPRFARRAHHQQLDLPGYEGPRRGHG